MNAISLGTAPRSVRVARRLLAVGMVTDKNLYVRTMIDVIDQVVDRNLYARTITEVVDHLGDTHLASILKVSIDDLHCWVAGQSRPPTDVFLRIIELKSKIDG